MTVLPSPNSFCSLHSRPINRETRCWARNNGFIWKAGRRGWGANILENRLAQARAQAPLVLREGGDVVGRCKHRGVGILFS